MNHFRKSYKAFVRTNVLPENTRFFEYYVFLAQKRGDNPI